MELGYGFRSVERRRTRCDAIGRERLLSRRRDGMLREGMWQGLEFRVVFERQMRAFVGFDEGENLRSGGQSHYSGIRFTDCWDWLASRDKS